MNRNRMLSRNNLFHISDIPQSKNIINGKPNIVNPTSHVKNMMLHRNQMMQNLYQYVQGCELFGQ